MKEVLHALVRYFPDGTRATRPAGGFVLWVELPTSVDSLKLFDRAPTAKETRLPRHIHGRIIGYGRAAPQGESSLPFVERLRSQVPVP
jgi:hypothetical protein